MRQSERFIQHLQSLVQRQDRAALARLRRALGRRPGEAVEAMQVVVPFLPEPRWTHEAYFLVGALFATHPEHTPRGNMGTTFQRVGDNESATKRCEALLGCHADELGAHLRHAVSLARSKAVPINYEQLLRDIPSWSHPDRFVQLAWARAYWGPATPAAAADETANQTTNA